MRTTCNTLTDTLFHYTTLFRSVGVVAEKRLAQNRGRQAVGVGRESAEKAREKIDREGVHIIAVLGQVIIGINAAEQEVELPVKIAGQDRFAQIGRANV